jgi:hypothetical protein
MGNRRFPQFYRHPLQPDRNETATRPENLAMLAKEPSHGYELRSRLARALGPVAEG